MGKTVTVQGRRSISFIIRHPKLSVFGKIVDFIYKLVKKTPRIHYKTIIYTKALDYRSKKMYVCGNIICDSLEKLIKNLEEYFEGSKV